MSRSVASQILRRAQYAQIDSLTERLLSTHGELAAPIRERLRAWLRQLVRRRPKLAWPLLATIVQAFLCNLKTECAVGEIRAQLRRSVRLASKFQDQHTIEALLMALSRPIHERPKAIAQVEHQCQARLQRQIAAAVHLAQHADSIKRFVEYLSESLNYKIVPVRFDAKAPGVGQVTAESAARTEIQAYTDGQVIHLPPICSSMGQESDTAGNGGLEDNQQLNLLFGVIYLLTHEYLHLAAGSYEFSFASRRGKRLFRLLRPMRQRDRFRSQVQSAISPELKSKLEKEGFKRSALESSPIHDLIRFFRHFSNRPLIQYLTNALEDGRLETCVIKRRWPGIYQLHQIFDDYYAQHVVTSSHALTAPQALVNAIGMYAAHRKLHIRLTSKHKKCFDQAVKIIQRQRRLARQSVYDSLATARKLYLLLEKHLGGVDSPQWELWLRRSIDPEEVTTRLSLAKNDEEDVYERRAELRSDAAYEVKQPGIWLPEWNGQELLDRRVHVTMQPYVATKAVASLSPLSLPFPNLGLERSRSWGGAQRHWRSSGAHLARERLARYRVHSRLGWADVPAMFDYQQESMPLRITLLFDLSISCEAPKTSLGGESVICRAIQAGTWLASNLESQGAQVRAYGAIDGGRRSCQLFELNYPVSQTIASLRCIGAGGFRLGAFLRACAQAPAELNMLPFNGRDVVIALTDGDAGYLAVGAESIYAKLHRQNCPNCTSRHRCRVEHARGGIDARSGYEWLYAPRGYDLGDISHAVEETRLELMILSFDGQSVVASQNTGLPLLRFSVSSPDDLVAFAHHLFDRQQR